MQLSQLVLATALLFASSVIAANSNTTEPLSTYYSRPDLKAPALNITIQDGYSAGYVFIAPFDNTQTAPYIFDKKGNLIWSGYGSTGSGNYHNVKVCTYNGADHLCMFQGNQHEGYAFGHGIILNNNYSIVASVTTGREAPSVDMHEFNVINGGDTALVTAYEALQYDLSAYSITQGQGWLLQGIFQEVNVSTGEVIFSWQSIDSVPLSDSYILPNTTDVSGDGLTPDTAFDYFHINSVDKSSASNTYLISARHTSTVYNINTTDGSIIWRLSAGGGSDFACQGFNFSFQHDARFVFENDTHTIVSLWDNASNGFNKSAAYSSGKIIALDHNAHTATLLANYSAPVPGGIRSDSQGNFEVMANGNVFLNYGSVPAISEHKADGTPVLFATFGVYPVMNYRGFTFNWTGTPTTRPAVYSFARNDTSAPTALYVSWNGATEVRTWRFYGFNQTTHEYQVLGTADWAGFETSFSAPTFHPWVIAEALDGSGNALRNSSVKTTFVPQDGLASVCNDIQCPVATAYSS